MTWNEYLTLSEKTLSTEFHIADDLFYQKILHAVIGSLTEVEEILDNYDGTNLTTSVEKQGSLGEECADVFWYLAILFRELDVKQLPTYNFDSENPFNLLMDFTKTGLKFLDLLKKKIYYNKSIDSEVLSNLSLTMYNQMVAYCVLYKIDVEVILDKNIQKLRSRYGDKFSSEKAINRDLDVEKRILES